MRWENRTFVFLLVSALFLWVSPSAHGQVSPYATGSPTSTSQQSSTGTSLSIEISPPGPTAPSDPRATLSQASSELDAIASELDQLLARLDQSLIQAGISQAGSEQSVESSISSATLTINCLAAYRREAEAEASRLRLEATALGVSAAVLGAVAVAAGIAWVVK